MVLENVFLIQQHVQLVIVQMEVETIVKDVQSITKTTVLENVFIRLSHVQQDIHQMGKELTVWRVLLDIKTMESVNAF